MTKLLFRNVRSGKRKAALLELDSITKKEIKKEAEPIKKEIIFLLERVVSNWKSDVGFSGRILISVKRIAIITFPTGSDKEIWEFVDKGTKSHTIPETNKFMVFKAGGKYVPKTESSPARTNPAGGKVVGGTLTFTTKRKAFTHPGSKPRNFEKEIAEDYQPEFKKRIENAFVRTAKKTLE